MVSHIDSTGKERREGVGVGSVLGEPITSVANVIAGHPITDKRMLEWQQPSRRRKAG